MPYSPALVDGRLGAACKSPVCPFSAAFNTDIDSRSVFPFGNLCTAQAFNAGVDSRGAIPGLNTIHREVMDVHHEQLLDLMEPRQMTCALLGLGAIGDFHCLQLNLMYPEGQRAVNRLLLAFLRKQGTAGFIALVSALKRCYQDKMANAMMKTETEVMALPPDEPAAATDPHLDELEHRVASLEKLSRPQPPKKKKKAQKPVYTTSSDDDQIRELEKRVAFLSCSFPASPVFRVGHVDNVSGFFFGRQYWAPKMRDGAGTWRWLNGKPVNLAHENAVYLRNGHTPLSSPSLGCALRGVDFVA
nr:hypothetical protein BaRGS_032927 [Batillaria attramentaria]